MVEFQFVGQMKFLYGCMCENLRDLEVYIEVYTGCLQAEFI